MDFKRADELTENPRFEMSRILVEGFYHHLTFFSKDKAKLTKAFAHGFVLENFYVAEVNGEIAGFTGCSDKKQPIIKFDSKLLRKYLGSFKGQLAALFLKKQMTEKPYPFEMEANMGSIDFVATAPQYRGKGVNYRLIQYVMEHSGYEHYVLEVVDNNSSALRLYEKLGFKEFMRVPEKYAKQAGFDFYIYMTTKEKE